LTDATSIDAQTDTAQVKSKKAETPFLRWAGGKRWLVPEILKLVGNVRFDGYHEPFLGGGSVFFALKPGGQVRLSDLNMDLITVYRRVRDNPSEVADRLVRYENTS
jgi:DNA adenine methylase